MTQKQLVLLIVAILSVIIGALLMAIGISLGDKNEAFVGGGLLVLGLAITAANGVKRYQARRDLSQLRHTGKRVDATVVGVISSPVVGAGYMLMLVNPDNKSVVYESDTLIGDGSVVQALLDSTKSESTDSHSSLELPVYVDLLNSERYFVDVPYDLEERILADNKRAGSL